MGESEWLDLNQNGYMDGHTKGRGSTSTDVCLRHGRMTTGIRKLPLAPRTGSFVMCFRNGPIICGCSTEAGWVGGHGTGRRGVTGRGWVGGHGTGRRGVTGRDGMGDGGESWVGEWGSGRGMEVGPWEYMCGYQNRQGTYLTLKRDLHHPHHAIDSPARIFFYAIKKNESRYE